MGKSAVADEQLWSYCKQYNPAKGYVVGLILGQSSKAVDYIVHLARTPSADSGKDDKCSKEEGEGQKGKEVKGVSLAEIKDVCIANHACDVTRMLPGGMWVLGVFLIGSSDPFENHQSCARLRTILRHVRTELQKTPSLHGDSPSAEKLVLHLNIQKNLIACCSADLDSSAFRPVDWKFQKNPIVWTQIQSTLDIHYVKHLSKEESSKQLRNQLQGILDDVSSQVNESVCTLSNELLDSDDLVESIFKKQKSKSNKKSSRENEASKIISANLYMPMIGGTEIRSASGVKLSNGSDIMYFSGSPVSRVFVHQKATVDEACKAVKQDIIRSIAARMQMHADSVVEEEPCPPEDLETLHEPPRRVMIKLPSSNVTFSDYLFPGEGPEEALVSSEELLDLQLELDDVEKDLEVPAESGTAEWAGNQQDNVTVLGSATSQEKSSSVIYIAVGALTVGLIAFIIQLYFSSQQSNKRI